MTFPGRGPGARYMGKTDAAPVPPERRGRTLRRIVSFFGPYKGQVAIGFTCQDYNLRRQPG